MGRVLSITVVAWVSVLAGGCHDPRFQEQSEIRLTRIHGHLSRYHEDDAAGPQRIHDTLELHRRLDEQRAVALHATCGLCRRELERDFNRWRDERALRRSRLQAFLGGHSEDIDDTWAKMIY